MGDRAVRREAATPDDIAEMRRLTIEALRSGAFGFTTSRTDSHKTPDGELVPSRDADDHELLGIGSLQVQQVRSDGKNEDINMIVPINLLKPIMDDLLKAGRPLRPPRPWLGVYATEVGNKIAVAGISERGPAKSSDLQAGDIVIAIAGSEIKNLAGFFRKIWSLGEAGVDVPMTINRKGRMLEVHVKSGDRRKFLKGPVLH